MRNLKKYNKKHNYIGNDNWQYKVTNKIYKRYSALNYGAYVHDQLYVILLKEKYLFNLILLKTLFDIQFLLMGIFRSIRNLQPIGVLLTTLLYLVLLFSSPFYIYSHKKGVKV